MTVSNIYAPVSYVGDASTVAFAFSFEIFDETDLVVISRVDSTGVGTVQTLTTHYTVSAAPYDFGGTVTMVTAPAVGVTLILKRDVPNTQILDLANSGVLPAENVETAFDRSTMQIQQIDEGLGRTLQVPAGEAATSDLPNAVTRANQYLYFDSNGSPGVLGATNNLGATHLSQVHTATAGQTVFTLSNAYVPNTGNLAVFINGVRQIPTAYAETDTTTVTLSAGATAGDVVQFVTADVVTNISTLALSVLNTDTIFSQNGAAINRLGDRALVGGATDSDMAFPSISQDWMTALQQTYEVKQILGTAFTGATTNGAATCTMASNGNTPVAGRYVTGIGIPAGTTILASPTPTNTSFTMSANATLTTTKNSFTQGNNSFLSGSPLSFHTVSTSSGSTAGAGGVLGGIQTLNFTSAATSALGVFGFAVANNPTYAANVWGGYFEAHKETLTGSAVGVEIDVKDAGTTTAAASRPYLQSLTVGLQIGAGAGLDPEGQHNIGAAIQIVPNPKQFRTGIVFLGDSLEGTDGTTGIGTALAMAPYHAMSWFNDSEQVVARIRGTNTASATKTELLFASGGVSFLGDAGQTLAAINHVASSVNYISLVPATTLAMPYVGATGSDTNIDLRLLPKGTGVVRFGTHTTLGAETVTGYITIKEDDGTSRKLAVVS